MLFYIGRALCWIVITIFARVTVIGREHVPKTGGVLLAPNHTSFADPPLVGVTAPRSVWFMAKAELSSLPILGPLMRHIHSFPVRREGADRQALRRAEELLVQGEALTIFIEGGRSPDGRLLPPALGPAMIALRAGVPIVPVAIIDSDRLLPLHGTLHFSRVTIIYGEPLTFPHLAGKAGDRAALTEMSHTVARCIADLLRAHGAGDRVPPGYLEEKTQA